MLDNFREWDRAVVSGTTCRGFESLRVCYMLWGEHEDKGI